MADLREGGPPKPLSSEIDASKLDTISREEFNTSLTKINSSLDELRAMFTSFMKTSPKAPSASFIPEVDVDGEIPGSENVAPKRDTFTKPEDDSSRSGTNGTPPHKGKNGTGTHSAVPPPHEYGSSNHIPMPHIVSLGPPPMLDKSSFHNWQYLMKSHLSSSCTQLWRIVVDGFTPYDASNLTPREVVNEQLNVSALYIIQRALTLEDLAHIRPFTTAKEAWDHLAKLYTGNASIQSSKFDAVNNESDSFVMNDDESPEELHRRLTALGLRMTDLGCKEVNDAWIKRKFVQAILPFEEHITTIIRQRADFSLMSSNDVLVCGYEDLEEECR